MLRIGMGYDLHRLVPGRKLIIGSVNIPFRYGCQAHSDGDVLIHAIIDAIITPITGKNIGDLFPDSDPAFENADGTTLLKNISDNYLNKVSILNIDSVIILDKPKISPFIPTMRKNLSDILHISENQIGIKGKTSENTKIMSVESYVSCLMDINI